nr:transporter substrate-binding domain-containing protein [Rhizobium etli]
MTRITVAASISVSLVALSSSAYAGQVLNRVLASKTLTVAVGTDWGPMSHLNENKEVDGGDIDLVKGIAKHLGVEVKFVTPGWDLIAGGNWQGRWDLGMGQMVPTKARAEKLDFVVYCYGPVVAVVHKDSKAAKLSDLDGKVVGAGAGTTAESYAKHTLTPNWINAKPVNYEFKPSEVKSYESTNVAFDDLRLGDGARLDAVVTDSTIVNDAVKAGYPFKVLGTLFSAPGAIAMEKGDKEFHDKVAAAVEAMREDGTLTKLSMKWFGTDLTYEQ